MSRSSFLAIPLVAVMAFAAVACDDGGSKHAGKPRRSTTTSSSSTTSTTVAASTTSSSAPQDSTTEPAETIGTCGNQTEAIVAAITGSDTGGLSANRGMYTVRRCRIAASSPIWAAANTVPNPGVQLDGATVVLQRIGALWNVEQVGTSNVGCNVAPAQVITDLGLICG